MGLNQYNASPASQRGALMIEVLVAIVIGVIGLWGLMEMQLRLEKSEMESYQRTQAVIMLNDISNSMQTNRANASSYVTTAASPTGTGVTNCGPGSTPTIQQSDTADWCNALQGTAETLSSASVGSMIGGRGCVETIVLNEQYMVTVAWQGFTPISAPPTSVACGKDLYDIPSANCINDLCRRYATTMVRIAPL
ncbi:MAG: hypothetical protein V7746_17215 [Halioglobus sp.]